MNTKIFRLKMCCNVNIVAPHYERIVQICFMLFNYSDCNVLLDKTTQKRVKGDEI